MKFIYRCLVLFIVYLFLVAPCYSQDTVDSSKLRSISGEIISIQHSKRLIVVRWMQDVTNVFYDEMSFSVVNNAKIVKRGDTINFDGLSTGDQVNMRYYVDPIEGARAVNIHIKL